MRSPRSLRCSGIERGSVHSAYVRRAHNAAYAERRISGDPTPSPDDARLTLRLCAAADVLDIALLDHLIVGDEGRYFSFHESGQFTKRSHGA